MNGTRRQRLGLLEAGAPPEGLGGHGSYPDMFRALLGDGTFDYAIYDVRDGRFPDLLEDCDGYLVTGSACGVYDGAAWIASLEDWLRAALGQAPLIGICFGHQIMAQAFGGRVIRSPQGWGLGAHRYAISRALPWMDDGTNVLLPAAHQDQVVALPPGAELVAGSAFSPFGMLAWPHMRAFSLQLHPEFTAGYAGALVERQRGGGIDEATADAARASLAMPMDQARVAGWMTAFLRRQGAGTQSAPFSPWRPAPR